MKGNIFLFLGVSVLVFALSTFGFSDRGLTSGTSYKPSVEVKDYDVDPSLNMRKYDDLRSEIRENITKIGVFPEDKKRIVIYVWDFDNRSGYKVGASKIKDDISTMLLESGRFKLVEDAAVKLALQEMNLSGTGFIDQNNIKEFGKRLGIDYIMYGTINNNNLAGGEPNISLVLKLIEVETTRVVWSYEIGMNRKDFKTSLDAVVEESVFRNPNSLAKEWEAINKESVETYGKPISSISVFFVNAGSGIDDTAVVDKMTSALIQAKIPNVKVIDRANLSKIVEQISKEGYEESTFFKTKKEFGKFYSVDAFLYGTIVRDPKTGKTELNLKLAMVESATVDWGRKFVAEMTSTERESIGKIQQKEFSENVAKTVGAVGEVLGFILSAPGIGVTLSGGWLGGFTTPGMTLSETYGGYDLFKDQFQLFSFNLSLDFFRIRVWKGWFLETGIKLWTGSYTVPEDGSGNTEYLTSANFSGRILTLGVRYSYFDRDGGFFVKASTLPLIDGLSYISSKVSYVVSSIGYYSTTYTTNIVETKVPTPGTYLSPANWPLEFEVGLWIDGFSWSILAGVWFPESSGANSSSFEWDFGFNIKIPIFWWHPFSFLYEDFEDSLNND